MVKSHVVEKWGSHIKSNDGLDQFWVLVLANEAPYCTPVVNHEEDLRVPARSSDGLGDASCRFLKVVGPH